MIGKMGEKTHHRKQSTPKMKKNRIRVMENEMRMRNMGTINTMTHEIHLTH
jgi:hypothetical protein